MALSLKRLLNDDASDVEPSRPRISGEFYRSIPRPEEQLGESFNDIFNQSFDNCLFQDTGIPDFGGLDGADYLAFDAGEGLQEWADGVGQYDHSPLPQASVVGSSNEFTDDQGDTVMSNGAEGGYVCFGMIHNVDVKIIGDMIVLDAKLKPTQGSTLVQRFQLQDKKDHILLSFLDGTEFGLLRVNMSKALSEMLALPQLDFEAVAGTDTLRETIGRARRPCEALVRVSINVYGTPEEADKVGMKLSLHKLWLQKPDYARRNVLYQNPQVLEFEGVDLSILENPSEVVSRGRPKPRTEEEHLRQTVAEVYHASKRQEGLSQITVSGRFRTMMLKHQKEALDFMIQRETGEIPDEFRLWREVTVEGLVSYSHVISKSKSRVRPEEKGGGILADEMGMGKSLSILSLIVETLGKGQEWADNLKSLGSAQTKAHTRSTLVVVSSALLINNWCNEIEEHLEDSLTVIRYHGPNRPKNSSGLAILEDSDVVITTYNTLAKEFSDRNGLGKSSLLHDIEWYRIVLDEAHIIRRQATSFYRTCAELKANSRWCLTGTPIQNRLEDIGALFCFIRAKPFDSMAMFRRYIAVPFDQNDDETATQRLVQLVDSLCLRRTKELLDLPALNETVRHIVLNQAEREQYNNTQKILFRKIRQKAGEHEQTSKFGIFQANLQLRILCNHGTFQQPFSWQNERSLRDVKEAVISALGGNTQVNCDGCSQPMPVLGSNKVYNDFVEKCNHVLCSECLDDTLNRAPTIGRRHCPLCVRFGTEAVDADIANGSQQARSNDGELDDAHYFRAGGFSTKMNALVSDVQQGLATSKSIIFSCWTRTLNLVARHLEQANIPYSRIDGECPLSRRQNILDDFAKMSGNPVLIMTTGTGAFGLNLTCANRVFIVELQWNPSVESQAIARAIRLGQDQQVSVIRYIVNNTVEQDMQSQQQRKLLMAQKGFDDGTESNI